MDSSDRLWATFWVSATALIISIVLAITYCSIQTSAMRYKVQTLCIEKNAAWYARSREVGGITRTTHTCSFTV